MGYGSYSASDWSKLKSSRKLSNEKSVTEVFKSTKCNPKFDPKFIGTRECFDSEDHPNTTPIVVGIDVTGSMGYLAVEVATGALNELITKLYSTGAVEDPALMCAAYGDYQDDAPLQVTQFESDIRIAEQLLDLYFENGGSGEVVPTCLWDFLSKHTNIDAINKRGEKGFVFTIGDGADIRVGAIPETIKRVIGDDLEYNCSREDLLREVEDKFNVYHITIDENLNDGEFMCGKTLRIDRSDISVLPEIIISIIQTKKGMKQEQVLAQWDKMNQKTIAVALSQLAFEDTDGNISL